MRLSIIGKSIPISASERRHARSANNTIQAKRSVVTDGRALGKHLGEMRLSVLEKKLLLDLNAVLDKKLPILLGKCHVTMVLFLLGNIPYYHFSVVQIV